MEEALEPVVGAVERAADKLGDMRRSDEPMPRDLADDLHVVVGKAEGRRFRRTAEPRQSCWPYTGGDIHTALLYQPTDAANRRRPGLVAPSRPRTRTWGAPLGGREHSSAGNRPA